MQRLAIYDMDKTITRKATWLPFLIHAARTAAPWRLALLPAAGLATLGYGLKLFDRGRLKELTQALMLGRALPPAKLKVVAEAFAADVVAEGTFADARARIAADRAEGYGLVLATASYGFYARAIAERLGFDQVVATGSQTDGHGNILSRIEGENCYGPEKLRMILDWLAKAGISRQDTHIRFYSDHVSDAPVLEWADEPYAVNAHGPLRALAAERGWPILDWEH
jgi:HAD superfamily hydrolase (TIGR01490 family)